MEDDGVSRYTPGATRDDCVMTSPERSWIVGGLLVGRGWAPRQEPVPSDRNRRARGFRERIGKK
jgi:hypothetical protein